MKLDVKLDSKYLARFQGFAENLSGTAGLTGNKILIEQIKMEELKTESGIFIPTKQEGYRKSGTAAGLTHVGLVLLVGEDNKLPSGRGIYPGAVVWVSEFGVRPCTSFPGLLEMTDDVLQLTSTDNINMIFQNFAAYQKAIQVLNGDGVR